MQIKLYLKNNPRKKFLISSEKDDVPIIKIIKLINQNSLGFGILKIKNRYKILTDLELLNFFRGAQLSGWIYWVRFSPDGMLDLAYEQ